MEIKDFHDNPYYAKGELYLLFFEMLIKIDI